MAPRSRLVPAGGARGVPGVGTRRRGGFDVPGGAVTRHHPAMDRDAVPSPSAPADRWSYPQRVLLNAAAVLGVVAVIVIVWYAGQALLLVFAGVLVAVTVRAAADLLTRFTKMPQTFARAFVWLLIVGATVAFFMTLANRLAAEVDALRQQIPQAVNELQAKLAQYRWAQVVMQTSPAATRPVEAGGQMLAEQAPRLLGGLSGALGSMFIVLFIGVYLTFSLSPYERGLIRCVHPHKRAKAQALLDELGRTLRGWLLGQIAAMACVAVLTGIGLVLLGVPLAFALAVIAGLMDFIPNIGPPLSAVPALLLAFGAGTGKVLWVAGVYFVVQQLENWVIQPLIQRRAADIPPAVLITAQVVGGLLAGLLGLILAAPAAAIGVVLVKRLWWEPMERDAAVKVAAA
jgi:predicted PurR-regulated permease PerM